MSSTTANIVITPNSGSPEGFYAVAANFNGVDLSSPLGTAVGNNADTGSPSVDVTGVLTGEMVVDMVAIETATKLGKCHNSNVCICSQT